jgi:hypothetical protein
MNLYRDKDRAGVFVAFLVPTLFSGPSTVVMFPRLVRVVFTHPSAIA